MTTILPSKSNSTREFLGQVARLSRDQMCRQIETLLPQVPVVKKLFTALYVMNFFSYYFKSLKEANKIPIFHNLQPQQSSKVCPTLFPTFPNSKRKRAEFKVSDLLKDLSEEESTRLGGYLKQRDVPCTDEKAIQLLTATFENHVIRERPSLGLTHGDCRTFSEFLWKAHTLQVVSV